MVITNRHALAPFTVAIGLGAYPDIDAALSLLEGRVHKLVSLDADAMAHEAGSVLAVNMVMLGAMARHARLPIKADHLKQAIRENTKEKFMNINLKAFDLGYRA